MEVALLTSFVEWGGAEVHTVQLAHTLVERGHNVTVVCLTEHTYKLYQDRSRLKIPLKCLPIPKKLPDMSLGDWVQFFANDHWDACVLVKGVFHVGTWALDLAARWRFGNYLTIEHLIDPKPRVKSARHFGLIPGLGLWAYPERVRRLARAIGPRKVVCVSDDVKRGLNQNYGFPTRKLVTVRNGIDVERFAPNQAARETSRRQWGIAPGDIVFGAVGRLVDMKGYDIAIAGFQEVLKQFPNEPLRLVLVGEGKSEQVLRDLASQVIPSGRVTFAPFTARPWEPLNALDVFVMPSLNEGLPLTLLEAMACGCVPVATAVGGVREVVNHPGLGWVVAPGDPKAFAGAMIDAASQTQIQRTQMGQRDRERVVADFNATEQFGRIAHVIESTAA